MTVYIVITKTDEGSEAVHKVYSSLEKAEFAKNKIEDDLHDKHIDFIEVLIEEHIVE